MVGEVVDGQILSVQTHVGEEVKLVPVVLQDQSALLVAYTDKAKMLLHSVLIAIR